MTRHEAADLLSRAPQPLDAITAQAVRRGFVSAPLDGLSADEDEDAPDEDAPRSLLDALREAEAAGVAERTPDGWRLHEWARMVRGRLVRVEPEPVREPIPPQPVEPVAEVPRSVGAQAWCYSIDMLSWDGAHRQRGCYRECSRRLAEDLRARRAEVGAAVALADRTF